MERGVIRRHLRSVVRYPEDRRPQGTAAAQTAALPTITDYYEAREGVEDEYVAGPGHGKARGERR